MTMTGLPAGVDEAVLRAACADDRVFFKEHPDRRYRLRLMRMGEVPAFRKPEGTISQVVVYQHASGVRVRVGFESRLLLLDDEAEARETFCAALMPEGSR